MSLNSKSLKNEFHTSKATNIFLWSLQISAAGMFIMAGYGKLTGNADMVGLFNAIGIGQWFRYLTGLLEVLGAVLLVVPALAGLSGLLLAGVMVGAIGTHLFIVGGNPAIAILLFAFSLIIAYGRRHQILRLVNQS
jgi:putative oxidoreductase